MAAAQAVQQPSLHAGLDRDDEALEGGGTRQEHPFLTEPGGRRIEEHYRQLVGRPHPFGEPAGQGQRDSGFPETSVAVMALDQRPVTRRDAPHTHAPGKDATSTPICWATNATTLSGTVAKSATKVPRYLA